MQRKINRLEVNDDKPLSDLKRKPNEIAVLTKRVTRVTKNWRNKCMSKIKMKENVKS